MNNLIKVTFVGGPLDGEGEVHPLANALHLEEPGYPEGYYSINPYHPDGKYYWILKDESPKMKIDPLIKAKARQRKAAAHGRRTKLERCLNIIGLSLFAPPFGSEAERKPFTQRTFPGKPLPDADLPQANQIAMDEEHRSGAEELRQLADSRVVQFNQWEGWTPATGQLEIFRLISAVGTAIDNIEQVADTSEVAELVREQCAITMKALTQLAKYIQEQKYE